MLNIQLLGTAEALPERIVSTAEVAALCGVDAEHAEAATGVSQRHWLRPEEDPIELGTVALRDAVAAAGLSIDDVDVLIHASGSFPQPIPDGSAFFAGRVGFQGRPAFSVHSTCVSAVVALHQAALLIAAGEARTVAIVTCEVASRGLNFADAESSLLFGDGAAAMIVGATEDPNLGILSYRSEIHPAGASATQLQGGGYLLPGADPSRVPADFTFQMSGRRVLTQALRLLPAFLESLTPGLSSGLPGIDRVVPHQTSAAGMQSLSRFGWSPEQVEVTLPNLGNMIAASIPITLHRALTSGRLAPGSRALVVGTGAGLSMTGLVLQL